MNDPKLAITGAEARQLAEARQAEIDKAVADVTEAEIAAEVERIAARAPQAIRDRIAKDPGAHWLTVDVPNPLGRAVIGRVRALFETNKFRVQVSVFDTQTSFHVYW
jgi:hypothetical protein